MLVPPLVFLAPDVEIGGRRYFLGTFSHPMQMVLHSYVTFTI